ncbi:MAG: site-2 protease family protein [Longimicrobiales bacterium]|nr:site-2 protease family protein [Longimicrobiales bacterium]
MTGYRLGRIFGIDVHVHGSWLVIGGLVLWTLAASALPADYPELSASLRLGMAGLITLLFFVSLLAHELAHSVVAMARGIPVHRITFFLFGGMAQTSADSRSAGEEFLIAIAGPVMSFLLGGLFFAVWTVGNGGGWGPFLVGTAAYLTVLNLILGTFNLLPGFPMDGGRVLRSVIWKVTGDVTRATLWAARVGSWMAVLLMGYGVYEILTGAFIGGVWLIFIGMFIRNAARSSYRHHLLSRMQDEARQAWGRFAEPTGRPDSGRDRPGDPAPWTRPGSGGRPGAEQGAPGWPPPGRDVTPREDG